MFHNLFLDNTNKLMIAVVSQFKLKATTTLFI